MPSALRAACPAAVSATSRGAKVPFAISLLAEQARWSSTKPGRLAHCFQTSKGASVQHHCSSNHGQVAVCSTPSAPRPSLTVGSTRTQTAGMPSAFSCPLFVPCGPIGPPAPVNLGVRSPLKIRSGNSVQRLWQMSTSVQVHTSSTRESFVVPRLFSLHGKVCALCIATPTREH